MNGVEYWLFLLILTFGIITGGLAVATNNYLPMFAIIGIYYLASYNLGAFKENKKKVRA